MKYLVLALVLGLAACSDAEILYSMDAGPNPNFETVQVQGRSWTVATVKDSPSVYVATRDNNNLNPFGRPASLRTPQAISAIEQATGCRVVRQTVYQNVAAQFFASVVCK